jgi:hypothetical protein
VPRRHLPRMSVDDLVRGGQHACRAAPSRSSPTTASQRPRPARPRGRLGSELCAPIAFSRGRPHPRWRTPA